jgi:hypothetical protein
VFGLVVVSLVVVAGLESWRRSVTAYLSRTERGVCLFAELAVLVGPLLYWMLLTRAFDDAANNAGGTKATQLANGIGEASESLVAALALAVLAVVVLIGATVRRRRSTLAEARVITKD